MLTETNEARAEADRDLFNEEQYDSENLADEIDQPNFSEQQNTKEEKTIVQKPSIVAQSILIEQPDEDEQPSAAKISKSKVPLLLNLNESMEQESMIDVAREARMPESTHSRNPSTTRSIKRKIDALIEISDELLDLLNEFLANPKPFVHLIAQNQEYEISEDNARVLREVVEQYSKIKRKKIYCRSEALHDIGLDINSAIGKKTHFDFSASANETLRAFTEALWVKEDKVFDNNYELGVIAILAKNIEFTKRILLGEVFEEAAFVSYPAYRGQPARTMLLVSRKVNLQLDKEPLGLLPYIDLIERGEYIHQGEEVKLIFTLKDGSRRTEIISI